MNKFNTFSIWLSMAFILFVLIMLVSTQVSVPDIRSFYLGHVTEFAVALFVVIVVGFSVYEKRG